MKNLNKFLIFLFFVSLHSFAFETVITHKSLEKKKKSGFKIFESGSKIDAIDFELWLIEKEPKLKWSQSFLDFNLRENIKKNYPELAINNFKILYFKNSHTPHFSLKTKEGISYLLLNQHYLLKHQLNEKEVMLVGVELLLKALSGLAPSKIDEVDTYLTKIAYEKKELIKLAPLVIQHSKRENNLLRFYVSLNEKRSTLSTEMLAKRKFYSLASSLKKLLKLLKL